MPPALFGTFTRACQPPLAPLAPPRPPQDAVDSLQSESEPARALREIRARDPSFDMVTFLRNLRSDVQTVIKVGGLFVGALGALGVGFCRCGACGGK